MLVCRSARPAAPAGRVVVRITAVCHEPRSTTRMGGGEGRTSGGRHPVTPWGQLAKGKKTRKNKRTDKFIVKSPEPA